ncbi:MAG: ATP synthase F1 subunit delta [Flavobacteriales bacterium]|nr:ATP synthase F1 subunit delta [Flavobacteriales bacterium]
MILGRASIRYSKALLGLAIEKNSADAVFGDMQHLEDVIESNKDLSMLLKSPIIRGDKKQDILNIIFKGAFSELTTAFIEIIVRKGREALLHQIANGYQKAYKQHNNIVTAEVTTAIKIDEKLKKEIVSKIKSDKTVEIAEKIDSDILGGYIIRIGDRQVDASVRKKLNELKQGFNNNPYIKDF